jgi:hypothetical protein
VTCTSRPAVAPSSVRLGKALASGLAATLLVGVLLPSPTSTVVVRPELGTTPAIATPLRVSFPNVGALPGPRSSLISRKGGYTNAWVSALAQGSGNRLHTPNEWIACVPRGGSPRDERLEHQAAGPRAPPRADELSIT